MRFSAIGRIHSFLSAGLIPAKPRPCQPLTAPGKKSAGQTPLGQILIRIYLHQLLAGILCRCIRIDFTAH
jgi:hypothetical protein